MTEINEKRRTFSTIHFPLMIDTVVNDTEKYLKYEIHLIRIFRTSFPPKKLTPQQYLHIT